MSRDKKEEQFLDLCMKTLQIIFESAFWPTKITVIILTLKVFKNLMTHYNS